MMKNTPRVIPALIDISESTTQSLEIDLGNLEISHLIMPATFTGTTVTFLGASAPGGTFQAVYTDAGAALSITVAQAHVVALSEATRNYLRGLRILKIVSGSAEGADRTVGLQVS